MKGMIISSWCVHATYKLWNPVACIIFFKQVFCQGPRKLSWWEREWNVKGVQKPNIKLLLAIKCFHWNYAKCIRIFPESKKQRKKKKLKRFIHPEKYVLNLYDPRCSHIGSNFLLISIYNLKLNSYM